MSSNFTVIYDACVLYPAPLRDLLMRLALTDLYRARWTDTGAVLRLPEVIRATGLSKSQIYRLEAASKFPRRVRLSEATSGWYQSEIEGWLSSRPRATAQSA